MIEKIVFDKVCKCGNHMTVTVRKLDDRTVEAECGPDVLSPSCWMVGKSTIQCVSCGKRHRSYHDAYTVQARTWISQ